MVVHFANAALFNIRDSVPIYTINSDTEIIFVEDFKQDALSKMGLLKLIEPYQFIKLK